MRRKWLLFGYYLLAISLLSMTLSSCDNIRGATKAETAATETREARRLATRVAATKEAATMIAEVETYEARATSEAEATEAAATVAAEGTPEPISSGVCSTPGAWCVVEGRADLPEDPGIPRNEVKIAFPVDGGPVSGNFHVAYIVTFSLGDVVCIERLDSGFTLSGHFDPESGKLEGPADDWSTSWEVLEGCPNPTIEWEEPGAISWWATYDWTTGVLEGEFVRPEDVMQFHGNTVSEEPSNPLD